MTEILKDERGGGKITSHCKWMSKNAQQSGGLGASLDQLCSNKSTS